MSFQFNSYSLAEIRVENLSCESGIGVCRLLFGICFSMQYARIPSVAIRDIRIRVDVGRDTGGQRSFLGIAQTDAPWEIQTRDFANLEPNTFTLTLTEGQVAALEEMRAGHGLTFSLLISGMVSDGAQRFSQNETIQHQVSLSDWADKLQALNGYDYFVMGIPFPRCGVDSPLIEAVNKLKTASRDLADGRYDAVVATCRLAMESVENLTGEKARDKLVDQFKSAKKDMSKSDRAGFVEVAARHFSQLAHHPENDGSIVNFSRDEALMMLSIAIGIVTARVSEYRS